MVTALIPDIFDIFICDTRSTLIVDARCMAAAAMAIGFLLVETCFLAHESSILKANRCVFSERVIAFAFGVTYS